MAFGSMTVRFGCVLVLGLGLTAPSAHAQQASPLAEATGLACTFKVMTTGNWARGTGEPSMKQSTPDLAVAFNAVNAMDGSANLKGGTGNLLITVMLLGGNLHLVVTNPGGQVYLTSISASESRPGFYKAVHSRHELTETAVVIPGYTSRPEQYLGECAIVKD
ncbi:MAG: hypothetical protein ABL971_05645 [Vicinamibacterales bacterium]